ncbi:ABC transporter permease [Pseudoxanthomonas daejeonensis]|uniref:ABC transporter permease n=1 Tax=Pseudoxanthomonas daejeonensis TaxID=266062 RepID=UPI001F5426B4|nr:FtsX-like permease family protein [Pseudoxanthomonas daejeonensis]UNK57756.1 ABC transporter permease [Pseudoxanthomonas daejeonensis]
MSLTYAASLGLQGLQRHPRTMVLAVLTLALGLSSSMTMITLLAMLSADPLPGLSQRLHLAWVDSRQAQRSGVREGSGARPPALWKLADVQAMARLRPQVRQVALVSTPMTMGSMDGKRNEQLSAVLALGPMTSMFGVPLLRGRSWTVQEEQDRMPVIVLGRRASLRLLGTEDGVGQDVLIGQTPFRVIGISDSWGPRPRAHYLQAGDNSQMWGDGRGEEAFLPAAAALDAGLAPMGARVCDDTRPDGLRFDAVDLHACRWLMLWAELDSSESVEDYQQALLAYARDRHAAGTFERLPHAELHGMADWLKINRVVPSSVRLNLWMALALLGLCILNVAGLLTARLLRRTGEMGVRRVLGASRRSVVVQCLVEAGAASLLGGLLALPLTWFALWVVRMQDRGYTDMAQLQPALYLALLGLSLLVGLLVGSIPAWRASRLEPALQVKSL